MMAQKTQLTRASLGPAGALSALAAGSP
jgi:hypothetical protein